jgi:hypothetical protein
MEVKIMNRENRLSMFFRVVAITRNVSVIAGILACSIAYHPVHASDIKVRPERVLSVVTADWNGDGSFDRAILLASEAEPDQADLLLYLSESSDIMRLAASKKNIAWRGAMWGTQPTLESTGRGSLIITSANEAVGRNRWTRKITVVYRNKAFSVAGYTYSEHDTLAPGSSTNCDINYLTGKGVRNTKSFRTSAGAVALSDWSEASIPRECR